MKRLLKNPPPPKLLPQTLLPRKPAPTPLLLAPMPLLLVPKLLPLLRPLTPLLLRLLTLLLLRPLLLRPTRWLKKRSKSQPFGA